MTDYTETILNFVENEMVDKKAGLMLSVSESLIEKGIVDSLGVQILIAYLEKEFGIQISDNEIIPENFDTISSIACFVNNKLIASR